MERSLKTTWSIAIPGILFILMLFISCQQTEKGNVADLKLFRRSVLDQKTRMLTLQYDSAHFLAYDLKAMVPYQFWTGGVMWNGAPFNNIKTVQPASFGNVYWRQQMSDNRWETYQNGDKVASVMQFKSYEILPEKQVLFHYELKVGNDVVEVQEKPFITFDRDSVFYVREFSVDKPSQIEVLIDGQKLSTHMTISDHYQRELPGARPEELTSDNGAQYWLDRSGCSTCHQMHEQNIGPAYLMIAERYAGVDNIIDTLIKSVRNGSTGKWGQAQMVPHPDLSDRDIRNMVTYVLSLQPTPNKKKNAASSGQVAEALPKKPGFGIPLQGVHPSFDLIKIRPEDFKPRVAGMKLTQQGDLLVSTWDSLGAVYRLTNLKSNDPSQISVKMIASGLAEPLGLTTVGDEIYVMQKHELTHLIDKDGDGITDVYACVNNVFGVTPDFHEFSYGLLEQDGKFFGSLGLAMRLMSTERQNEDRGTVFSVDKNGNFEIIARGLRQPNGIGFGPENEIFVTENQGQWVPACKLIQVEKDHFYGCQFGTGDRFTGETETLPAVYLPQDEIGNSPGQPMLLKSGPYAGQMIFGDVSHGGIKRAFIEKVNGSYQGCVFRFTQGLEAGINRIDLDDEGNIYAGGVGMIGGWAHKEHQFGLQKLAMNGKTTFEILSVKIDDGGFLLDFTSPVSRDLTFDRSKIKLSQWRYESTERYGGPKIDQQDLAIQNLVLSDDRKQLKVVVPEVKQGYVVYFLLDDGLYDQAGNQLWTGETWYTVKSLATGKKAL
ncbi:MAG: hypothetical protein KDC53_02600 [Saprospiraceae bacterium]|nr:hypothetical protein [Saprospiraceae bacterium]